MQFFISHLATWLRTRRFSEPTFRPSGATNHRKNTVFRDFPTFSRTCIFFLLTLSLLWSSVLFSSLLFSSLLFSSLLLLFSSLLWLFPHLLFHLFILSEVWLLNFLRWYCALLYYHRNDGVCTMGIIPCTIEILDIWYPHMLFPIKGWHGWYGDGSSYLWNCHMNEEINIHNAILFGVPNTDDMEEVLKIWGSPRHRKTIHGFQCWNALNDLDDLGVPHGFWRLTNNHRES